MNGCQPSRARRGKGTAAAAVAAAGLLALGACDFEVVNPGPTQDEFLDNPDAFPALVNGVKRAFMEPVNEVGRRGATAPREVMPSGNTGRIGIGSLERRGVYRVDGVGTGARWNEIQDARWTGEDALRRMNEVLAEVDGMSFDSHEEVARAQVWTGFVYRFKGDNFCGAVFDGGPLEPKSRSYERGEELFTDAIATAGNAGRDDLETAAYAGRAQIRAALGDWDDARSDAETVLDRDPAFEFLLEFSRTEEDQYNHFRYAQQNDPYRSFTIWATPAEPYYEETGDPRVAWTDTGLQGTQPIGELGAVSLFRNLKHTERTDPVRMSSGREMQLILAEAELRDGNVSEAVDRMNELREGIQSDHDDEQIPLWDAETSDEAWEALIRERGIELWLEGRRLGDFHRWIEGDGLGMDLFHPLEVPEGLGGEAVFLDDDRDLCLPISQQELDDNPNIDSPVP